MTKDATAERILDALRVAFFRKKLSHKDVAEAVGTSTSAVSRRLSGDVQMTIDEIAAYAEVAGVAVEIDITELEPVGVAS